MTQIEFTKFLSKYKKIIQLKVKDTNEGANIICIDFKKEEYIIQSLRSHWRQKISLNQRLHKAINKYEKWYKKWQKQNGLNLKSN